MKNITTRTFGRATTIDNSGRAADTRELRHLVEGSVAESETGEITEIHVSDFTPAPEFDERWFESKIGAFPGALTGTQDAAAALDEFRS